MLIEQPFHRIHRMGRLSPKPHFSCLRLKAVGGLTLSLPCDPLMPPLELYSRSEEVLRKILFVTSKEKPLKPLV